MINWISVKERLPESADLCIVHIEHNKERINFYDYFDARYKEWKLNPNYVTHWIYAKDLPFPN